MTDLLLLAYDYLDYLRSLDNYQTYLKLNKSIKETYKSEFEELNKAKTSFEAVLEVGRHHPDFKDVSKTYSNLSKELYSKPDLLKQVKINQELESRVNTFLKDLTNLISKNIPILNELGIITNKGGVSCGCWADGFYCLLP